MTTTDLHDLAGTSRQAIVYTTLTHLDVVLGDTHDPCDPDKTHVSWTVQTPHGVAEVYDYGPIHTCQQDCPYDPRQDPVDRQWEWHIGGHNPETGSWVAHRLGLEPHP